MAKNTQLKTLDSNNGVEKMEVPGFESLVPQIRKLDEQMEELANKRDMMKALIINTVRDMKQKAEVNGSLYKSFTILSEDGQNATILYKNQFSKLDPENEESMRKTLKDSFETLFENAEDVTFKKNADTDVLRKLLGDKFEQFFSTKKYIKFCKDFMERRASLRPNLNKSTNALLDKWTSDNQASPDLRMKG